MAQQHNGSIAGVVKDSSDAILPGALVQVQPTGKRAASDTQGAFRIVDLPPGKYTVTASYVGFSPIAMDVTIQAADTQQVNPVLKVASAVDQVVVSGERLRGEAEAINIERTSDNIIQVLPSKVINSLPNTNIADAVGRLPSVTLERDEGEGKYVQIRGTEPRLSNTTIDGVNVPSPEGSVRNVKLDVIPAGLVERIEVNKTLSANQDADAIGGSVNLVTKTASEKPTYSFGASGGYTPIQDGRWLDSFDGTAGRRFGASKRFGGLVSLTYDHNDRAIDDLEPLPVVGQDSSGNNIAYFSTEDLRTYKYYRTRYGLGGGVDYVIRPGSTIYVKGLFSDFHDYGDTWVYTPSASNFVKSQSGSQTTFYTGDECNTYNSAHPNATTQCTPGNMQYRHYIRRPDQQIFSILSGWSQLLGTSILTVEFAGARSHNIGGQDFATTNFSGAARADGTNDLSNIPFVSDSSNPRRPKFTAPTSFNLTDAASYTATASSYPRQHSTQLNFQGSASLAHPYTYKTHSGTFEFGLKIRNAHKTQNQNDQLYNSVSGLTLNQVLSNETNSNYYDGSYKVGPLSQYSSIVKYFQNNPGTLGAVDTYHSKLQSYDADYDATERVYAGYLMNTISFSKLRIQTGVRVEATGTTYSANNVQGVVDASGNPVDVTVTKAPGSSDYINVLPSVQVQYQIEPNTNLRATYGRGISRPNFSDIVPAQQVDPNTTPPSITEGNPALKPTNANDYDVLLEHYFKSLGVLQAGFFYKDLADPIYSTTTTATVNGNPNGQLKQSVNGPSAHIAGVEMALEQRLSYLPRMLNGLGVSANYSYTTSQVTFPSVFGRTDHAALQRQAPNAYNLGLTYDKARFSGRFGLSHNDKNIYSYAYGGGTAAQNKDPIVGLKGPGGDVYLYSHTQYDVQGSYRLIKSMRLVVSGLNLSNEVFGFFNGSSNYPIQREYYHPSVIFGIRWSGSSE